MSNEGLSRETVGDTFNIPVSLPHDDRFTDVFLRVRLVRLWTTQFREVNQPVTLAAREEVEAVESAGGSDGPCV